jgi:hypothetical protein
MNHRHMHAVSCQFPNGSFCTNFVLVSPQENSTRVFIHVLICFFTGIGTLKTSESRRYEPTLIPNALRHSTIDHVISVDKFVPPGSTISFGILNFSIDQ